MGDFKSYRRNEAGKSGAAGDERQAVNLAAAMAKAFAGKSEGQILATIIAQAEQGKRDGTLSNADLDNFYRTVAPLLDSFKRRKLQQVIAKLKAI